MDFGFDFDAAVTAPFRMRPGLRKLAPAAQHLTPLAPGCRHQREKLAVLSAFADQALLVREGFDARAALAALCEVAAREHPQAFAWDGAEARSLTLGVTVSGQQWRQFESGAFGLGDEIGRCLANVQPEWRLAALLSLAFAEDFAIVNASDGCIPWLAVALPSFWAPSDKIGRHFAEIHAPVADNSLLIKAADALVQLVSGGEPWERFVWTITAHPRLHAHPERVDPARWSGADAHTLPARAWWRSERQTFIPVAAQRQAVFTIAVDVQPLAEVLRSPERAAALLAAVASMSAEVLAYRGLTAVREPLLHWLARSASAA
jgi:dimethylamine monooxygenase subunit A